MMTKTQSVAKPYLCTVRPDFACHNFTLKVRRFDLAPYTQNRRIRLPDGSYEERQEERAHYRAIDLPINQRIFSSIEDEVGTLHVGAIHDLTDEELEYIRDVELPRYVVRWVGRYNPPKNRPEKRGVGPDGRYVSGRVIAIRSSEGVADHRYMPRQSDEPVSKYVIIKPVGAVQRALRNQDAPDAGIIMASSRADQEVELMNRSAKLDALALELERREAELAEKERAILAQAEIDEAESLATREGQKTQRNQARKKRRG